ncbi:chymotrypsin inhibitor-like [Venturia canescens]|uniref:chymotrypsin inhibitor-like n=1 Tax=Venturia canescens TaxID=32260 RepID=UPI001C9D2E58|nr:chymotrypsin inhibitor-like [Venturia canescens]XP_043283592.1 chymotrypsin inhibitor-like [Venturia canescens]XP_043283593.1 chymotrypsin inhibitor-like [Venturia canescens]
MPTKLILLLVVANFWATTIGEECADPNAKIHICGQICAPSCGNLTTVEYLCPAKECNAQTSGCRCNPGFVNLGNSDELICVLPHKCPPKKKNDSCQSAQAKKIIGDCCK